MTTPTDASAPSGLGPSRAQQRQGGDRCYEEGSATIGQGRVEYAVAGAAMRQAFARAHETRATARELRMLNLIVEYTGTYSKLADRISMSVFERRLGWHHRDVRKVRGSCIEKRLFTYTPSSGRVAGLYGLPPAQPSDVEPGVEPPDVEPEVAPQPTPGSLDSQPPDAEPGFREGSPRRSIQPPPLTRARARETDGGGAVLTQDEPEAFQRAVASYRLFPDQRARWLSSFIENEPAFMKNLREVERDPKVGNVVSVMTTRLEAGFHRTTKAEPLGWRAEVEHVVGSREQLPGLHKSQSAADDAAHEVYRTAPDGTYTRPLTVAIYDEEEVRDAKFSVYGYTRPDSEPRLQLTPEEEAEFWRDPSAFEERMKEAA